VTGWWFSPGPPVSSTNKTDRHDITEIVLKVALSTIKPNQTVEIKESSFSDTMCLIPHCGDKRMVRRCRRSSVPDYIFMTS